MYKHFKTSFGLSNYINILDKSSCKRLIAFLTRNHRLPIEIGRWQSIRMTSIITLLNLMFLTTTDHNTSINIITNDLTCINLLNFYNQNMFKNWVFFAFSLWKSLRYNAIDNYITIKTLLHFCQYTISFFKSMSILWHSDI